MNVLLNKPNILKCISTVTKVHATVIIYTLE